MFKEALISWIQQADWVSPGPGINLTGKSCTGDKTISLDSSPVLNQGPKREAVGPWNLKRAYLNGYTWTPWSNIPSQWDCWNECLKDHVGTINLQSPQKQQMNGGWWWTTKGNQVVTQSHILFLDVVSLLDLKWPCSSEYVTGPLHWRYHDNYIGWTRSGKYSGCPSNSGMSESRKFIHTD